VRRVFEGLTAIKSKSLFLLLPATAVWLAQTASAAAGWWRRLRTFDIVCQQAGVADDWLSPELWDLQSSSRSSQVQQSSEADVPALQQNSVRSQQP
jgi:hypothetical protein